MKRDRYQNADALNALIASLAMRNNSLDKGAAFIKFLNNHNQNAFLNDRQTDKKKRYAYTPLEIQLTTNLFDICNYHCKSNNVEDAIEIFCILGYTYYRERKLRFRQRMENERKKRGKKHNKRSSVGKHGRQGRKKLSREDTDIDLEISETDEEYSIERTTRSRQRSGLKQKTKDKGNKKVPMEKPTTDNICRNEQEGLPTPYNNLSTLHAQENEIPTPHLLPPVEPLFNMNYSSEQVINSNQSTSDRMNNTLEYIGSDTEYGYHADDSIDLYLNESIQDTTSSLSLSNNNFQDIITPYSPYNEVNDEQNHGVRALQDYTDYFQDNGIVEEQDYEVRLFQDNINMQQIPYNDPFNQYNMDNMMEWGI